MHIYKLDIIVIYVIKCLLVYEGNKELLDKYWTWKRNEGFGPSKDQEKDQQPPKHKYPLFLPKLDIIVILPMYQHYDKNIAPRLTDDPVVVVEQYISS